MPSESVIPQTARKNIDTISQVEQQLLARRSFLERIGQSIARFFGSLIFIVAHLVFFTLWMLLNTGVVRGFHRFDPYPFPFLALIVGIEFILLTTFVLMNQKFQIQRNEQWSHLHLQLSMLTEQEVTKNMQMLNLVCRHLGVERLITDQEISELARPTAVTALVGEIEKSRSEVADSIEDVQKRENELMQQDQKTGES